VEQPTIMSAGVAGATSFRPTLLESLPEPDLSALLADSEESLARLLKSLEEPDISQFLADFIHREVAAQ
jgi:hypothetical protein